MVELFAVLVKRIWTRQNHMLHKGEFTHPNNLAQEVVGSLMQYQQAEGVNTWGVKKYRGTGTETGEPVPVSVAKNQKPRTSISVPIFGTRL